MEAEAVMIYLRLFFEFLKVGLFTFGGGLAALPFLYDIANRTGWYSQKQLADMIAISESTPGPIGINMATYVGFHTGGILGGVLATLGFIFPSILIVTVISHYLIRFQESRLVKGAFYGLRAASVGLIATALLSVLRISLLDVEAFRASGQLFDLLSLPGLGLAAAAYLVLRRWNPHPVFILAGCALAGLAFGYWGIL